MGRTSCTEPQCLYKGALYLYRYSVEHNIGVYKLLLTCVLHVPAIFPAIVRHVDAKII